MLSRLFILLAFLASLGYMIATHMETAGNIILAVLGFSAVVFIHECGHFFVAKACDIRVEVFSVFIPPVLLGIRRLESGWRVRILPQFFPKEDDPDGDGALSFTFGSPGKAGETEYRIGLIPVAGYVKMLGQEDIGADKQVSDPRSFGNKSIGARMAVISAGVTFNVIAAVLTMTLIYMIGIYREPPVIGDVVPGSPADRAGLQMGDRILAIGNKTKDLEFEDIPMAAALSSKGQAVPLRVRKRDGSEASLTLVAEDIVGAPVRLFGIYSPPSSLTVAQVKTPDQLMENTGLKGNDRIVAADGQAIEHYWELREIIRQTYAPTIRLTVERQDPNQGVQQLGLDMPIYLSHIRGQSFDESEQSLNHIASMLPRLRVDTISPDAKIEGDLQSGDVIVKAAGVDYPNYLELRHITKEYAGRPLTLHVARADAQGVEASHDVIVYPHRERGSERVVIGVGIDLDAHAPVVAQTLDVNDLPGLDIPRGATLTQVAGTPVTSFYDVIAQLRAHPGQTIQIDWRAPDQTTGRSPLTLQDPDAAITVTPVLAAIVPFKPLQDLHRASGPIEAFTMGSKKSVWFILQTYVTIKKLFARDVALKAMSGPVGIATIAYQFAQRSIIDFLYLLAFISANLAVVNFLPVPVVDGGVFVLLIVEKIQGRPLSLRVQEIITYAGLTLILSLFLYLTYNDILRLVS
jgi:regulator of sigma E protease